MDKIIVFDIGAAQFRSIFNYLGQYKKNLNTIMKSKSIYEAKRELNYKIRNRIIFIGNPDYTFCNMISGYCNDLKVDLEDLIICAQDYGSWRKDISKEYKAQRRTFLVDTTMKSLQVEQKEAEDWIQGQYDVFNGLYEKLSMSLPINFIHIFKMEADDIASVCCRYYTKNEIILVTNDADWSMLAYFPNVKIFSIITKKFKEIKNPEKVLLDKINGDISDNLIGKPSSELEFEKRKKLVDLIAPLPDYVEQPIREALAKIMPKSVSLHKIPFNSIRNKFKKIYNL